ncbi:unnamed protein product [Phyllotreta striolata]|uniref:NADH dehydrogenase [ubiquinone] 1 alpha subcomplex subunit 12 n=1 Tax=Phyllotreta striolata TaxID=444603 RepID=A0A9N9TR72_PHYSR|nr:unnamed protein product [Phyllotreta striolata]
MASYFGIDRFFSFLKLIKDVGIINSVYKVFRMDNLRPGKCVGFDQFGNKYFENRTYFIGRSRWVEYAPQYRLEYDASQVPPKWFGWLHYKTDYLPDSDPTRPNYKWMLEHTENLSGTPEQYMPYSTTRPKIIPWVPERKKVDAKSKCKD